MPVGQAKGHGQAVALVLPLPADRVPGVRLCPHAWPRHGHSQRDKAACSVARVPPSVNAEQRRAGKTKTPKPARYPHAHPSFLTATATPTATPSFGGPLPLHLRARGWLLGAPVARPARHHGQGNPNPTPVHVGMGKNAPCPQRRHCPNERPRLKRKREAKPFALDPLPFVNNCQQLWWNCSPCPSVSKKELGTVSRSCYSGHHWICGQSPIRYTVAPLLSYSVSAVIGMIVQNRECAVNLFGQHHPRQLMWQGDLSQ